VQPHIRGYHLSERGQGLRKPVGVQRDHPDRGDALELRQYTGPSAGLLRRQRHLPEADARRAIRADSSGPAWPTRSRATTRSSLDLFNEPYPERATGSAHERLDLLARRRNVPGHRYQVAGLPEPGQRGARHRRHQRRHDRRAGLLERPHAVAAFKPSDSAQQPGRVRHVYNFNTCSNTSCYDSQMGPVAAQVPLSLTEIGENDCDATAFVATRHGRGADAHGRPGTLVVGASGTLAPANSRVPPSSPTRLQRHAPTAFGRGPLRDPSPPPCPIRNATSPWGGPSGGVWAAPRSAFH
jgi:hypothetical protein